MNWPRAGAALLCGLVVLWTGAAIGANPHPYYALHPKKIAKNTYALIGKQADFSPANHGDVVNTAFIVTAAGVVVIDTGPSKRYGQAMRAAIARITDRPVVQVYITHAHPDHFLGNAAFGSAPIAALTATIETIRARGAAMTSAMYDRIGAAMRGTRPVVPGQPIPGDSRVRFGKHVLRLIAAGGHSNGDLMIFDTKTGVLFTGDIAFYQRAPETPGSNLARWRASLKTALLLPVTRIVPGHGPVTHSAAPLRQTQAYLAWLARRMHCAAARGESAADLMVAPLPPRWRKLALEPAAYRRSVVSLYPAIERHSLRGGRQRPPRHATGEK